MAPSHEDRVKNLKLRREAFRLELQTFKDLLDSPELCVDSSEIGIRMKELEGEYAIFAKTQVDLDSIDEKGELLRDRMHLKSSYLQCCARANKFITPIATQTHDATSGHTTPQSQIEVSDSEVQLPKINLPIFSGNYEDWPGFADQFRSTVHENTRINDCRKLMYLRSCLKGEALKGVESLSNTAANYMVAWAILEKHYNKPAIIVSNHLKTLFELPIVTRPKHRVLREFLNTIEAHYRSLVALKQPTTDTLLIHLFLSKLDEDNSQRWKERTRHNQFPPIESFLNFLDERCQVLEPCGTVNRPAQSYSNNTSVSRLQNSQRPYPKSAPRDNHRTHPQPALALQSHIYCSLCKEGHYTQQCETLTRLPVSERLNLVRSKNLCSNCLRSHHKTSDCRSTTCRRCHKKHHTLLHIERHVDSPTSSQVNAACLNLNLPAQVLLSTAVITILDKSGQPHPCRVLLDSCSQSHFLSKRMHMKLGLAKCTISIPVTGMNEMSSLIKAQTTARIKTRHSDFSQSVTFLLVNEISQNLPTGHIDRRELQIPENTQLADPKFYEPGKIDGLIGAQLFWELLCVGQVIIPNTRATLQKTLLGWVVTGEISKTNRNSSVVCNLATETLRGEINKFWELEERVPVRLLSTEERACESHYASNTQRDEVSGRYTVRLPFKRTIIELGESHSVAFKRFIALERSLNRNLVIKEQYIQFMREYLQLGHMSEVVSNPTTGYFLPHHAVRKAGSLTTKIRVVFDASAKSTSGTSLNDSLMVGPVVQEDLFSIVLRFRSHKYVLTADITKMYRQIELSPADRKYHKILWREHSSQPIKTFELNTVTYGTACAPYLATITLQQLADDERTTHLIAAKVLKNDFYVDDVLTGADTLEGAQHIRDDLITLTSKGGFQLRQWASNEPRLLEPFINSDDKHMTIHLTDDKKTLGLYWTAARDTIGYTVKENESSPRVTKRTILSKIAQLFDPLGLLGPIVIKAKLIMQSLWKLKSHWDESVPMDIYSAWTSFQSQLATIQSFSVPQRVIADNMKSLQLHGFCDASERAYGACLYIRTTDHAGNHHSHLLCSKTRVAPLKTQSLPRLELCAAVLLINLYRTAITSLKISFDATIFWTDSMITLHWIRAQPHTLKQFVANRVAEIQEHCNPNQWRHVPSTTNPADILSRGMNPLEFLNYKGWEQGPQWLSLFETHWPVHNLQPIEVPEQRKLTVLTSTNQKPSVTLTKFSSFNMLKRVIAYCFRFYYNALKRKGYSGQLTVEELRHAHDRIIKLIQNEEFHSDRNELSQQVKGKQYKGRLAPLKPFIVSAGLMRVGGRLTHSELIYDQKHPLVLPSNHKITELLIREYHNKHGHAGIQATLNAVREKYWPINGKSCVKAVVHRCITCHRVHPSLPEYIMGDLPRHRVTLKRPFLVTGVDYCGPFYIKEKRLRNTKQVKCYIAVFVCFATKAVHIELVSDLTTDAFLASLRRFFSRRGKSSDIYSDNGTNFVGANREIQEIRQLILSDTHNEVIKHHLANDNIRWHFIPPRAPHFGGLWEAAVKSVKQHVARILGNTILTYEAFYTCLTEIEAILNSRPLTPMSDDPSDLTALTPGHFLIGDSIISIPERDFTATKVGRLSRWQQDQQIRQHFWRRWHKEYLNEITVRRKWHQPKGRTITEGMLVIIKEDNLPPLSWPLGRIINIHPGEDGIIRIATIKTAQGTYKRAIKRLAPLPIDKD